MPDLSGLPHSLKVKTRWLRLAGVPALIAHPDWPTKTEELPLRPWVLWMHGRTVTKEIDPGRFQRLVRAGIACVAVDLPGHGERSDPALQRPESTVQVIGQMVDEIDAVVDAAHELSAADGGLDLERIAIGGMSAGGMATLARLCRPHRFRAAVVECTTGSWRWQPNLLRGDPDAVARLNPIEHLNAWRPIPLLVLHNRHDAWVPYDGQREFVDALIAGTGRPDLISTHVYEKTGAPYEHAGFGTMGADAKDRAALFLARFLGSAVHR